jgi:type IVB pilus formation R64 PilN family outer membrane protein
MKFKLAALSAVITLSLTACVTAPVEKAEDNIKVDANVSAQKFRQASDLTAGQVNTQVVDGYYLGSHSYKMTAQDKLPERFDRDYTFNKPNQVSLQEIISNFGREFKVKTLVSSDAIEYVNNLEGGEDEEKTQNQQDGNNINSFDVIDPAGVGLVGSNIKFSVDFKGTGSEFLDYITAKTNLFWKWEENQLTFFRTDSKNFKVDYLGGLNSFTANVSSSFRASKGDKEGSVGSNANTNSHNTVMNYSPENVWDSLSGEIEGLLSKEGKFAIAEEAGLVSVTDTPRNLELVGSYLKELNKVISQQIAIRAEIYDVVIDENASLSTDWSAAYGDLGSNVSTSLATAFSDATSSTFGIGLTDSNSRFNGSQAFINSLNQIADVSYRTSATVNTTNGMAAPIQMLDTTGYLSEVTREVSESTGKTSTSVEQATAKSGFSLNFLPRVTSQGDINIMFAGDLTQLRGFDERNFEGTTIQLPDSQNKNFLQRIIVKSGQSIMVAGFERTESTRSVDSVAGESTYLFGGKKSGGTKKVLTVIMLTPYAK